MMASKTQQQLNFPVRKSGRQSKPSRIIQESNEQKSLSAKKVVRECKRGEQEDTPRRRAAIKARTQSTGGAQSHPETDTPTRTPSTRRQRKKKGQSPCVRDCTPQRNIVRDSNFENLASPLKLGTPRRTASSRHAQFEDSASPCKRDQTPQRTVSARTFENDASPCGREHTPQKHLSAKRTLQIGPGSPNKRDCTPVRSVSSRQQQQSEEKATSPSKSPCKRKADGAVSPSTPPKSPCKSGRNVERRSSRGSSPDIQSEESDSEEEGNQSTSHSSVWPHNKSPMKNACYNLGKSPSPLSPCGKGTKTPTKNTDGGRLREVQPVQGVRELRSPSKQRPGSVLPPLTPPASPFVISFYRKPTAQENATSRVAPSTPTKNKREVLSPRKSAPRTPQKQLQEQQCGQSSRVLSPIRPGTLTPQKQQAPRAMVSPQRTPCSPNRQLFTNSPQRMASPRKMAGQENTENFTLKSPKLLPKLKVARADGSSYQRTKQSLHTAKPEHLVGREDEVKTITTFLQTHLEKGLPGSLYISGAPGTGKTAALLHIIDDFQAQYTCRIAYLNCMMVKDVNSVFRRLHSELSGKPATGRTSVKDMETLVTSSKNSMLLVLDEIDQLDSKNQEVLYTIFEWPSLLNSKLILVGVANALDLTDRILPRLQAKPKCRPTLLHFAPYTRNQITAIIQERLTKSGDAVVDNSAVQFCARKVAAVAGDMRKALDVCRRAVELVESETRCQTVLKATDCNSPSKRKAGPTLKRVGVGHISKVMGEVYGTSVQSQHSEGVPLQQKLTVCTLLLMVKTAKIKEVLLGKLHEAYCKVSRRQQMSPVDQSEFHSLCVLLEARGVISMKKAKETRLIKITLRQDEKELEQTLKDKVLVSAILATGLPK